MNGLHAEFGDRMDFIDLDIDNPDHNVTRAEFKLANRSTYLFIAPDGTIIRQWSGPLNAAAMQAQLSTLLDDAGY